MVPSAPDAWSSRVVATTFGPLRLPIHLEQESADLGSLALREHFLHHLWGRFLCFAQFDYARCHSVLVPAQKYPWGNGVAASTSYSYPDQQWAIGHVAIGPQGPDPVRRVLTFTSSPLESNLTIAGPAELVLFASSTRSDADFIVKLSEQLPQSLQQRAKGIQPSFAVVTKGWLRAQQARRE